MTPKPDVEIHQRSTNLIESAVCTCGELLYRVDEDGFLEYSEAETAFQEHLAEIAEEQSAVTPEPLPLNEEEIADADDEVSGRSTWQQKAWDALADLADAKAEIATLLATIRERDAQVERVKRLLDMNARYHRMLAKATSVREIDRIKAQFDVELAAVRPLDGPPKPQENE